jgi:hypothetical protein
MSNSLKCPKCGNEVASETLICSNCQIEIQPIKVYDTVKFTEPKKSVLADFGAKPREYIDETLFEINESKLVEKAVESSRKPLADIFSHLEIDTNDCWVATNIPTPNLIPDNITQKLLQKVGGDSPKIAGDIDLIVGDIKDNDLSFDRLIAFQVKIRRMDANEKLSHFSSGEGTGQAFFTALMGFDRTVLLHIFVREPKPVTGGFAASWNPITNSEFARMMRASYGAIKNRLKRESYGYGWLGWGQAFGREADETGGIASDIIVVPPLRPKMYDADVCVAREELTKSLINLLSGELKRKGRLKGRPFVFKWPIND